MGDWITHEDNGRIETHVGDKLSSAFHGVANFFQDTNDKMKTDPFAAELVSGMAGVGAFTLGFWALKKMLFEKIGMDGMGGDVLSLVGAVVIGLAMFNLIANKDADSRAAHMRQQWAETHPQGNSSSTPAPTPSRRGELTNMANQHMSDTGMDGQEGDTARVIDAEKGIQRAHKNNPALFPPDKPATDPEATPDAARGTRAADDLVAQAPASRPGRGGPGFG